MKYSNEENKERISLFMDNQYHSHHECQEVMDLILQDKNSQKTWQEYYLIQNHLQGISPDKTFLSQQRILSQIHQSPPLRAKSHFFSASNHIYKGIAAVLAIAVISIGTLQIWPNSHQTFTESEQTTMPIEVSLASNHVNPMYLENPYLQLHQQAVNAEDGFMRVANHVIKD